MKYDLDHIVANSYRDFHAKGLDYLCLERRADRTTKVYFFDGEVTQLPEVVIPHDHRYNFTTDVLAGAVQNKNFAKSGNSKDMLQFERFDYVTPLNGGDGFTWSETAMLREVSRPTYYRGQGYFMHAAGLHTIKVQADTVLRLTQGPDVVAVGIPTSAYRPAGQRQPPSLDGLYSAMTHDHAIRRLAQLDALMGDR